MAKKKRRERRVPTSCPCDTARRYLDCCGPLHSGERTAEQAPALVRARFSAYCVGDVDYLWHTLHSQHPDRAAGYDAFVEHTERSIKNVRYRALRILDSAERDSAGVERVLFWAQIMQHKRDLSIVELSDFVVEGDGLRYIVGNARPMSSLAHGLDELRIDHWECGHHHH